MRYTIDPSVMCSTGGYSTIHRCVDSMGTVYACKVIENTADADSRRRLRNEICSLHSIQHPNVVRLYEEISLRRKSDTGAFLQSFVSPTNYTGLVTDMWCGHVEILRREETEVAFITRSILCALAKCHDVGFIHKDIKPSNFLISDCKTRVSLCDFGMALRYTKSVGSVDMDTLEGTPKYMSPEMLRRECMPASDIWSLGVSVFLMLTMRVPFGHDAKSIGSLWKSILSEDLPSMSNLSEEASDFISRCLVRDPNLRPTALELLDHPFVKITRT